MSFADKQTMLTLRANSQYHGSILIISVNTIHWVISENSNPFIPLTKFRGLSIIIVQVLSENVTF
jgi:hypothetical protein